MLLFIWEGFFIFPLLKCFTDEAWYDFCEKTPVHVGFGREYNRTWDAKSRMVKLI